MMTILRVIMITMLMIIMDYDHENNYNTRKYDYSGDKDYQLC